MFMAFYVWCMDACMQLYIYAQNPKKYTHTNPFSSLLTITYNCGSVAHFI